MHPGGAEPGAAAGGRVDVAQLQTRRQATHSQPSLGGALSPAPGYARTHGAGGYWHRRDRLRAAPRCHRRGREAPAPGSGRPQSEGEGERRGRGRGKFAPLAFPDPPSTSEELLALHSRVIDLKLSPDRPTSLL